MCLNLIWFKISLGKLLNEKYYWELKVRKKNYDFDWSRNWVYINIEYKLFNFGYFVKII